MYILIPQEVHDRKLSDAEKGLSTLVYWSYYLSQNKGCLKMESSEPGSSLNSSRLFTAAESESVIKYLVRLQSSIYSLANNSEKVGHSSRPYTTGILIPQSASAMVSDMQYQ